MEVRRCSLTHTYVDAPRQGDSPYEAALAFGAKHGLAAEGVAAVTKHITAKAGKFLKRVFFYLPFYVDVAGALPCLSLPPF
eukprot:SAG31_NODE_2097_length_6453_cov_16.072867_10_plen_81_part_00